MYFVVFELGRGWRCFSEVIKLFLPQLLRVISPLDQTPDGDLDIRLVFRIGHSEPLFIGRQDFNRRFFIPDQTPHHFGEEIFGFGHFNLITQKDGKPGRQLAEDALRKTPYVRGDNTRRILIDPGLSILMSTGWWPTFVHPLLQDSPALDAGDPAGCYDVDGSFLVTDQVGQSRQAGPSCDIGSYERPVGNLIFDDGFESGGFSQWSDVVGQ